MKGKEERIAGIKSASELTFYTCQLLSSPSKSAFQAILDENDIDMRMKIVAGLIAREVKIKAEQNQKLAAIQKRRSQQNLSGTEPETDEIAEMQEKLGKLGLPEETKKICDGELKKVR